MENADISKNAGAPFSFGAGMLFHLLDKGAIAPIEVLKVKNACRKLLNPFTPQCVSKCKVQGRSLGRKVTVLVYRTGSNLPEWPSPVFPTSF